MNFKHLLFVFTILSYPFSSILAQAGCISPLFPTDGQTEVPLSFNLEWNAPSTGDAPDMYHVYWGTDPGALSLISSTTSTSVNIEQPAIGATFYWEVAAEANGSVTPPCATYSYTTVTIPSAPIIDCGAANPIHSEFLLETNPGGFTGDLAAGNVEYGKWNFGSGQTSSSSTGPMGAHEGNQYLFYESSFNPIDASLVSPQIDLTNAVGDVALEFYMHAYGASMGTLEVGISTSPAGPFTNVWTWVGQLQTSMMDNWELIGLDISAYAGQQIYVEFLNTNVGSGGFGDLSLDLITVDGCEVFTPQNDACISAIELSTNGEPGTLANENTSGTTDSGIAASNCNATTGNDLFYTVETDEDGGALYIDLESGANSKFTVVLYENNCSIITELACATAVNTGDDVQLAYFVSNFGDGNSNSRMAAQTFIIRVYDENNVGENFNISSSGSAFAALPISLVEWKAELVKDGVNLLWSTAMESNTDRFEVEKSFDGRKWNSIGTINAKGYSSELTSYSYLDINKSAIQYYRLRSVDFDNYQEISNIIKIQRDDITVNSFPNPVISDWTVSGEKFISEYINIQIYSIQGQLVKSIDISVSENITIDLASLISGMYNVKILDGQAVYHSKLVKK